jgi:hypothetical protein
MWDSVEALGHGIGVWDGEGANAISQSHAAARVQTWDALLGADVCAKVGRGSIALLAT